MYYELTNTPVVPVSLSEAKEYLRVDNSLDDAVISTMIEAAVEWGEGFTNSDFRTKDWEGFYPSLCQSPYEPYGYLPIEKAPLQGTPSLEVSSGGSYSTFTDTLLKKTNGYSRLLLTGATVLDGQAAYTYKVTFSSGYTSLPAGLTTAILEHVAFLYENRGDAPSTPPEQVRNLYGRYKHIAGYA